MIRRAILQCLLLFVTAFNLEAIPFNVLSTDDGLSSRRVEAAASDKDGYVWVATRSGIDRYDGESFTHYPLPISDNDLIEHPKSVKVKGDTIYAFTEKSILFFSYPLNTFIEIKTDIPTNESINDVEIDAQNNIWIGTSEHLYCIFPSGKRLNKIIQNKSIHRILTLNENNAYIGTASGVYNVTLDKSNNKSYLTQLHSGLNKMRIQSLFYDPETANLWIGTFANGIYIYNTRKKLITQNIDKFNAPVRSIADVGNSNIWAGIDGVGIYEYNKSSGQRTNIYSQNAPGLNFIEANNIYHILNKENTIWISTFTKGVFVYNKSLFINSLYTNIPKNPQSLANNHVNAILEDNRGRLWFGTNHGISRYDQNSHQWKHFFQSNYNDNSLILTLISDSKGNVWASGYSCDIIQISPDDNIRILDVPTSNQQPEGKKYIYAIAEDFDGDLWFGGIINDLIRYSPSTNTYSHYSVKGVNQIAPYSPDTLLMATTKGIMFLNKKTKRTSYPIIHCKDGTTKFIVKCFTVLPSNRDEIWIGTEGQGLLKYNIKTGNLKIFHQSEGLSSDIICDLEYDDAGRIWVSTENGLNCIQPETGQIELLNKQNGLPDNIFNFRSGAKLKDGTLMWGTVSGAFGMDPNKIALSKNSQFNLRFEEFSLFNSEVYPGEKDSPLQTLIDRTDKIKLSHNENSFAFRFIDINYANSSKNLYSWRLDDFDKSWSVPSTHHHAVYTNIPPGKYTFKVKVFNGGNISDYQERGITIIIAQPWWNTWWAWIIYCIVACLIIYYLYKNYREHVEVRDSDNKIKFFVNIAHDIRTPLTLIKAPLYELEEDESLSETGRSTLALAQRNTEKLIKLVSQLLDFQKIERRAMTLQVEKTDIYKYIGSAISNFEPLAREKQINIHIFYEPIVNNGSEGYIDTQKMSIILDNLLSNSIKYTCQKGNVSISASIIDSMLHLVVEDDGIGIPAKAQKNLFRRFYRAENASNSKEAGSGIGLLLTKRMVTLHKGQISFSSDEGKGTSFIVDIPVGYSDYSKAEIIEQPLKPSIPQQYEETTSDYAGIKLMIVEDNDDLRSYIAHFFNGNYNVVECSSATEAIDIVPKANPDFIISDVMMPGISGLEFCKRIKSNIETCHIPVILLTSLTERNDIIAGLDSGADDYVIKPFDIFVLKSKIGAIINNRLRYRRKYIDKTAFQEHDAVVNELDKNFMQQVVENIEKNMSQEEFNIDNLASDLAMSRSVFFKKIKSLTGQNPQELIRDIKMKRAATLLQSQSYTIVEIAEMTGYPNSKYFSTAFKKYYGVTPTGYIKDATEISNEDSL